MEDKKRVLHFELTGNIGGIESFILNLYKNIDRSTYKFDFITTSETPVYKDELETLGGRVFQVPIYKDIWGYTREIKKIIAANNYDIIHIHKNSSANIIPAIIAKKISSAKIIVHSHNTLPTKGRLSGLLHKINRSYLYNVADEHLACSNIAGKWMFGDRKYEVIPNGVDTSQFLFSTEGRKKIRSEFGIPEDAFIVGNVGRFTEQKNHRFIIDIFESLLGIKENAYLILVGTGELEDEIKERVKKKCIAKKVIFTGKRNDIPDIMSALDVFLMPSFYEGLPIVAVEAQANGLRLCLSDTIAKETDIFRDAKWIDLAEDMSNIANKLNSITYISQTERLKRCQEFSNSIYTIKNTVNKIRILYIQPDTKYRIT